MINVQTLTSNDKTVRTQITLTLALKKAVEDVAENRGESLSEYLRKAAIIRLFLEKREKEDMKKLALEAVGSVDLKKNPKWNTRNKVYKWVRSIREEK